MTDAEKVKPICKDCQHARKHWLCGWLPAKCKAPQNMVTNAVSGEILPRIVYCENLRAWNMDDTCGPDGKWFDAKP